MNQEYRVRLPYSLGGHQFQPGQLLEVKETGDDLEVWCNNECWVPHMNQKALDEAVELGLIEKR